MQNLLLAVASSTALVKRLLCWTILAVLFASFQTTVHAARVLYVQNLSQRDTTKLINILRAQGHDVTVWTTAVNGNALTAQAYADQGYQLLIVDEVISSGAVGSSFVNSPIPVINWEGFLYNNGLNLFNAGSGLSGGTFADAATAAAANSGAGADYGQVQNETNVNIVLPGHPLAAGLPAGNVAVWHPEPPAIVDDGPGVITFAGTRTLISGATVVARVPGFAGGAAIFGVDIGVTNFDGVTTNRARWVHLPWNDTDAQERVMVEPSFFLFEAAVAWALRTNQPTKIYNLLPEPATFQPTNLVVTFSVDKTNNAGSAVATSGIALRLNGSNVISAATMTDGGARWNVAYTNNALLPNRTYTIVASAISADGGFSARQTQIDTFSLQNFSWEAEDFNFDGGMFIDNPVLCTDSLYTYPPVTTNCYWNRVGFTNIDKSEVNFTLLVSIPSTNEVYRFGDPSDFARDEFVDTFVSSDPLLRPQYVTAGMLEYDVRSITNNEWLNYTRSYPTGFFNIYIRAASAGPMTVQADLVGGDTTTSNQTLTKLGRFVRIAGTSGYEMVALTDDSGNTPLTVQFTNSNPALSNVVKTIRMTALSGGHTINFYMLVPTTAPPNQPPTISLTSPTNGAVLDESAVTTIAVTANDPDGSITNVQFAAGLLGVAATVIGNDTTSPFSFDWSPQKLGNLAYYVIQATAMDNRGLSVSTNITVKVVDSSLKIVTTAAGSGADAQLTEYNHNNASGVTTLDTSANTAALNARLSSTAIAPTGVHEVVSIRLDLTGYSNSQIRGAALNLMNIRGNSAHILHLYAVKDGTVGLDNNGQTPGYTDNTWNELAAGNAPTDLLKYSTMPGLFYDATPTATYDTNNIVDLGSFTMQSGSIGRIVSFQSGKLTSFLNTNSDSLVTILIDTDSQSTGQKRFASKEATTLEGANAPVAPPGTTNWFAPFLSFAPGNPTLNFTRTGNAIQFSWMGAYKLQTQTNSLDSGLGANWFDYPGGATSPVNATINPANPSVFYRLISP